MERKIRLCTLPAAREHASRAVLNWLDNQAAPSLATHQRAPIQRSCSAGATAMTSRAALLRAIDPGALMFRRKGATRSAIKP